MKKENLEKIIAGIDVKLQKVATSITLLEDHREALYKQLQVFDKK